MISMCPVVPKIFGAKYCICVVLEVCVESDAYLLQIPKFSSVFVKFAKSSLFLSIFYEQMVVAVILHLVD